MTRRSITTAHINTLNITPVIFSQPHPKQAMIEQMFINNEQKSLDCFLVLFLFYFSQGNVNRWPFPCVVPCITIWRCFQTSSIKHKKRLPLRSDSFFLSYVTAVPPSFPFCCVLYTPLPAVNLACLAESFVIESRMAVCLSWRNSVSRGQRT